MIWFRNLIPHCNGAAIRMSELFHYGSGNSPRREISLFHLIVRESSAQKAKGDVSFRQWFPLDGFSPAGPHLSDHHIMMCVCLISDSPRSKKRGDIQQTMGEGESHSSRAAEYLFSLPSSRSADSARWQGSDKQPLQLCEWIFQMCISRNGCWSRFASLLWLGLVNWKQADYLTVSSFVNNWCFYVDKTIFQARVIY